mmetsp:Transcript_24973/g.49122  ORF Transcript_24973/g.49122 Transcript_24973/m.49122 type:complete len:279 (+) Transcript_24973:3591-4427(+)
MQDPQFADIDALQILVACVFALEDFADTVFELFVSDHLFPNHSFVQQHEKRPVPSDLSHHLQHVARHLCHHFSCVRRFDRFSRVRRLDHHARNKLRQHANDIPGESRATDLLVVVQTNQARASRVVQRGVFGPDLAFDLACHLRSGYESRFVFAIATDGTMYFRPLHNQLLGEAGPSQADLLVEMHHHVHQPFPQAFVARFFVLFRQRFAFPLGQFHLCIDQLYVWPLSILELDERVAWQIDTLCFLSPSCGLARTELLKIGSNLLWVHFQERRQVSV